MLHYLALIIFGFAFLLIILEAYDKSLIALSGALLMVVFRILTPTEAIEAIEFETILLLLAMMILVNIASKSGDVRMGWRKRRSRNAGSLSQ